MEWVFGAIMLLAGYALLGKMIIRNKKSEITATPIKPKLNVKQTDISNITLSSEQIELFNRIENTRSNMFITGKAGTGKSVLLQYFKENTKKKVVVVAPTGVAALNVGGQTIHSLFRIKPGFVRQEDLKLTSKTALLLRNIDTVVIDEISMVRADLMDGLDYLLRLAKSNNLPFGVFKW
jgi:ATP-dependent DNA helicase PIF1